MAITRKSTGSSKPRTPFTISTAPSRKPGGGAKRGVKKPTTTKAPATHHKRKPSLKDKVEGAAEKVLGKIERKPGKEGAGTKKMRGTDGKGSHTTGVKKGRGRPKKEVIIEA